MPYLLNGKRERETEREREKEERGFTFLSSDPTGNGQLAIEEIHLKFIRKKFHSAPAVPGNSDMLVHAFFFFLVFFSFY